MKASPSLTCTLNYRVENVGRETKNTANRRVVLCHKTEGGGMNLPKKKKGFRRGRIIWEMVLVEAC